VNKRTTIVSKSRTATFVLMAAIMLAACSSTQPPLAAMAVAESAVQRANTADTRTAAPGELQIAIAKLTAAQSAMDRKDYELAYQLALQTQVDAELAQARAQAVTADIAAQESQAAARALRTEVNN
jgi:predicted component of type VI protein secretion system